MGMRHAFVSASALALAWIVGCSCSDGERRRDAGGGDEDAPDRDVPGLDAPRPDFDAPVMPDTPDAYLTREEFCMGRGPAVIVGDTTMMTDTCAGSIASRVFDHATCSCTDTNVVGYLHTASFDSGLPGTMEDDFGAPVGVNRDYLTGGYADVGGSMVVAGTTGVTFAGYLRVGGDAVFAGNVSAIGRIDVSRDFWILGNVPLTVMVNVDRDVHQPTGRTLGIAPNVGGSTIRGSFAVPPPCHCAPAEIVDIASIVATAATINDNASVGLMANELDPVIGIGRDITLPCGRFYLTGISGLGDITLHVDGRTALFIQGDVNALGVFDIDLGPEGELDMFIAGNLLSIGRGSYGDRARPAATRIYVGGTGDVTIIGATGFVGNVYAPRARITAPGATTVYGSLFGNRIDMPGYLDVRYDRAILDVDVDCPPPTECGMCGVGPGCTDDRACIGGTCAACTSDADCCAPLVCYGDGTCGPLLF